MPLFSFHVIVLYQFSHKVCCHYCHLNTIATGSVITNCSKSHRKPWVGPNLNNFERCLCHRLLGNEFTVYEALRNAVKVDQ